MTPLEELAEYCGNRLGCVTLTFNPNALGAGLFLLRADINDGGIRGTCSKVYDRFEAEHSRAGPGGVLNLLATDILKEFKEAE